MKEAQQPRFKFDDSGALVPDPRAEAAIIYNPETGKVLWETHGEDQRSIASITKVMTAVVFLEDVAGSLRDRPRAASRHARRLDDLPDEPATRSRRKTLLHLMLIASDNAAARVLARSSSARRRPGSSSG